MMMIFVDHIPRDVLGFVTLHDFGFCDAAEVFVLLAGVSSVLAYGRAFEREGALAGLRRIALRCGRIYVFQVGMLLLTMAVVYLWDRGRHEAPGKLAPLFQAPITGLEYGLTLRALPTYLDILPLYIVLLAVFPFVYLVLRRSAWLALGLSGLVWMAANLDPWLDLPNWIDGKGWYFNPFAWQFLFTLGAVLANVLVRRERGLLTYRPWLAALCWAYLFGAFLQAAPWHDWGLPDLRPLAVEAPDKSLLAWPRILDIGALVYVAFSSTRVDEWARHRFAWPLAACGRHSLEVFSTSCMLALLSRLGFRAFGPGPGMQVLVNAAGVGSMVLVAVWLERSRERAVVRAPGRLVSAGGGAAGQD